MKIIFLLISTLWLSFAAAEEIPACKDKKKTLDFNEAQILEYRANKPHKFKARALVRGVIVGVLENRQGHLKIEVDFDGDLENTADRMIIVYNLEFGEVPAFAAGDPLVACGDFVVDDYSPTKAVVHWLHASPRRGAHDDGFMIINGVVTGLVIKSKP